MYLILAVASTTGTFVYAVTSALDENKKNIELMGKNIELMGKNTELAELRGQLDTRSSILNMAYGVEFAEWQKQSKKNKGNVTILYNNPCNNPTN